MSSWNPLHLVLSPYSQVVDPIIMIIGKDGRADRFVFVAFGLTA